MLLQKNDSRSFFNISGPLPLHDQNFLFQMFVKLFLQKINLNQ